MRHARVFQSRAPLDVRYHTSPLLIVIVVLTMPSFRCHQTSFERRRQPKQGSCRGTALAVVVNEAVATASATVAGASKRRDSFTTQERVRTGTDMLRRLSRDNCEPWITSDRNSGLVKAKAAQLDFAETYPTRSGGIAGSLAGMSPPPPPPALHDPC